jgi:magnesium transporter
MITDNLKNRSFSWFDVVEPREEDLDTLSNKFNIPYLLVQDTLRPEHLPKYEFSEEGHFLMMRSYDPDCADDSTTVQELTRKIALYISEHRVISIHRVELDYLVRISERCSKSENPKTLQGLIHQIILGVIRTYEEPIQKLQLVYDDLEADVLTTRSGQLDLSKIYHFRRQLFVLKRILKQTNDSLYRSKDMWEEYPSMLQDLKENIDQLYFQLDEVSDNLEHLFQLHFAMNDERANQVMKVLTVFSSVLLPLNFIASFYGMNFEYLPGLHSIHAFGAVVISMVVVSLGAIWVFKRKGWFSTSKDYYK